MNPQDFGERMKTYENVSKNRLVRKIPAAIRIDAVEFDTLTALSNADYRKYFDYDWTIW